MDKGMSAEERAREHTNLIMDKFSLPHDHEMGYYIMEALSGHRREALQEAAKVAEDHAWTRLGTRYAGAELNSTQIAEKILALIEEA